MDLDLSEYDQIEEIAEGTEKLFPGDIDSKLLVTLSSGSDRASLDGDINCENDFVFLPSLSSAIEATEFRFKQVSSASSSLEQATRHASQKKTDSCCSIRTWLGSRKESSRSRGPLEINTTSNSIRCMRAPMMPSTDLTGRRNTESFGPVMPIGVIKYPPIFNDDGLLGRPDRSKTNKLAELMQQIVIRSDTILIAIPCQLCHDQIACPPSDISAWLNHMGKQHNCRVCPICNRLIGLGPLKELEIMRLHVIEHFDEEWLDGLANKINFTFGLQQHWFSGYKCSIRPN